MPSTPTLLHGGCHCGSLALAFSTALEPMQTTPRACDCSFCRAHGAAWVSDPGGHLAIHHRPERLPTYRQGSLTAQFVVCNDCGVLVAVVFDDGDRRYAAVNVRCLDARDAFAAPVPASPQALSKEQKEARWRQAWIADVVTAHR